MKYCPNGHPQWLGKDNFCRNCGEDVSKIEEAKCENGHDVIITDAYCGTCGIKRNV